MKQITKLLVVLFYMTTTYCLSQQNVDIRLVKSQNISSGDCFDIELRSPFGRDIKLAGQNYRLFYDASKVSFNKKSVRSYLHQKAYTEIDLINTTTNNIGFISLSTDGRALNEQVVVLSREGTWYPTANFCFNSSDRAYDLTWAHEDKTLKFASATVALSEWTTENTQQILEPNEVFDYTSYDLISTKENQEISVRFFPNPVVDYVTVEVDNRDFSSEIIIKDVIGREVVYDRLIGKSKMLYDLTNWPEGLYTFELLNEKGQLIYSDQLVKARP